MVSVAISHVIGTTALLVVFFVASTYYANSYLNYRSQILSVQLQEAADYVSSNFVDLISLCSISSSDQLLVKTLEMPKGIGTDAFSTSLIEMVNPITFKRYLTIRAIMNSQEGWSMYKEATLPWVAVKVWNGTIVQGLNRILPGLTISSTASPVIWVQKLGTEITIGLGTKITSGAVPKHSLTIIVQGQGSTSPYSVGTVQLDEGTNVAETATPASGWVFTKWHLDQIDHNENPIPFMMNADKVLTVTFTPG